MVAGSCHQTAATRGGSSASSEDETQLAHKHTSTYSLSSTASSHSDSQQTTSPPHGVHGDDDDYVGDQQPQTWTAAELLEVRARERTFDGAYWRTSIGLFGASLVILRVFGLSFFPVGLVFLGLGLGFLGIGLVRRRKLINRDTHAQGPFVTSGGTVLLSGIMCLSAYTALLVLLVRM
ncbi:hypothetical protein GQ54DRAFT_301180 [Martensiomyces pterosporus]|nr:hypothetical protein GQ54DRAFT_301180 [Martensiomyces pterosporus]